MDCDRNLIPAPTGAHDRQRLTNKIAKLSSEELEAISSYPLKTSLQDFRTKDLESSSMTEEVIDQLISEAPKLKKELSPTLQIEVPDFFDTVFEPCEELGKTIFRVCPEEHKDKALYNEESGWSEWPRAAKEKDVLEWLQHFMDRLGDLAGEHSTRATVSRQFYQGPRTYGEGSPIRRKMDVGFAAGNGQGKNADTNEKTNASGYLLPRYDLLEGL